MRLRRKLYGSFCGSACRLGCSVVLCEETNVLGGAAVNGLVNIWHSLNDTEDKKQVISGLTQEMLERLEKRDAVKKSPIRSIAYNFNPSELAFELDSLTQENSIDVRLHTRVCDVLTENKKINGVIIEDHDGRGVVQADFFIDCTGDGDIMRRLGETPFTNENIQPPSACFFLLGNMDGVDIPKLIHEHGSEFGLEDDWGWSADIANCEGITMRADNHVFNVRCDIAADLTKAEITGRKQMRSFLDLAKKYGRKDTKYAIANMASYIGIRESVHYSTQFKAEKLPLLCGTRYEDAILNGTYPLDMHHSDKTGITFWQLDGTRRTEYGKGTKVEIGNWRKELNIPGDPATYYQVPFKILVQNNWDNIIAAGRMLNADSGAFGALRVMVNLNQLGEAADCAAAFCLDSRKAVYDADGKDIRKLLIKGGSAL